MEIRSEGRGWSLAPGRSLTFGRAPDRDIQIGAEPLDLHVSRHAGVITAEVGGVMVRNDSRTQELLLLPLPGRQLAVPPGRSAGLPNRRIRLQVFGQLRVYEIMLDQGEGPVAGGRPAAQPAGLATMAGPHSIALRELRMLAALCEPLLLYAGPEARAASFNEVAARLGLRPDYVRRSLSDLRERLSNVDGVPRLRPDDVTPAGQGFAEPLADWAIRTGVVTVDVLRRQLP